MKITNYNDSIPYIIIDDLYNENELSMIWEELNFLCYPMKFSFPTKNESATDQRGNILKNNKLLYIDTIYTDRKYSNILNINRKIFKKEIMPNHPHWIIKNNMITIDSTLISYYENGAYYKKHQDTSSLTALTWFYKSPKKFSGGDLILSLDDEDIIIEVKNNKCVIFPSIIHHTVTDVSMNEEDEGKLYGRICMTQFLERGRARDLNGNYI